MNVNEAVSYVAIPQIGLDFAVFYVPSNTV